MQLKAIKLILIGAIFCTHTCEATVDSFIVSRFHQIIKLIESDNAKELSELISYPLKRDRPLHSIDDAKAFIDYYPTLFDRSFKDLLQQYDDSVVFQHNGDYGLVGGNFSGEIWINGDGKIAAINYSSEKEQRAKQTLIETIKKEMHPSVRNWDDNVVFARSAKLLIRIDRTGKGLRYVCWTNGKTMKDSPDIILYNGVEEAQGTMGGWTWTFKNEDWVYIVADVEMCENDKDCGLFLQLDLKGKTKSTTRLTEIK